MRNLKIKTKNKDLTQYKVKISNKTIQLPENINILYDKENLKYNIFINPEQYFNFATKNRYELKYINFNVSISELLKKKKDRYYLEEVSKEDINIGDVYVYVHYNENFISKYKEIRNYHLCLNNTLNNNHHQMITSCHTSDNSVGTMIVNSNQCFRSDTKFYKLFVKDITLIVIDHIKGILDNIDNYKYPEDIIPIIDDLDISDENKTDLGNFTFNLVSYLKNEI